MRICYECEVVVIEEALMISQETGDTLCPYCDIVLVEGDNNG